MATIKSYTDIEQSKKLVEILSIESANMAYWKKSYLPNDYAIMARHTKELQEGFEAKGMEYIPCWSLAALMNVFPKEEGSCTSLSFGYCDTEGNYVSSWLCCYEKEGDSTDDYIIETITADNPIDCCYKMILKLKDRNIL